MLACVSMKPAQSAGWRCCCWFWWCIYSVLWLHFAAAARHAHIMRSGGMLRLMLPACLYCVYKRVVVVEALKPCHAVGCVCGIYYVMRTQALGRRLLHVEPCRSTRQHANWVIVKALALHVRGAIEHVAVCVCLYVLVGVATTSDDDFVAALTLCFAWEHSHAHAPSTASWRVSLA